MLEQIINNYKEKITGITHVGAGIGQEVGIYLSNKINNINLFEPQSQALLELRQYNKYENVNIYEFGLANFDGDLELHVTDHNFGASSSILKPKKHKQYFPEIEFKTKETIKVRKYISLDIKEANFLVMDVQGFELEVLKGFENSLNNYDFIFTEVSRKEFYENNVLISDIDNYLKKYNFIRYKVNWVSNKPQGDAFYISKKNINLINIFYLLIIGRFQNSYIYFFINFFKNKQKAIYTIKRIIKKYIW